MSVPSLATSRGRISTQAPRLVISDDDFFDYSLFFLTVLATLYFNFLGQILFSDLLVPFLMVIGLVVRGVPSGRVFYAALLGAALWMFSLVASDIVNHSTPHNYLRGWARNGLGCAYLVTYLCILRPNIRSLTLLVTGLAMFEAVSAEFPRPIASFEWFVKMGGGSAVVWMVCLWTTQQFRKGNPILPILVLFLWTGVALSQNVRSNMTITFAVTCLSAGAFYFHRFFRRFSLPVLFLIMLVSGGVLAGGLAATYNNLASSGALGKAAQKKYEFQARGGDIGQIWNARPELRVALAVIADSPILGHGSWYHDPKIAAAELLFSGYVDAQNNLGGVTRGVIMSNGQEAGGHSVVLQSWVEAGIFGAMFWIGVFLFCLTAVLRELQRPSVLSPIVFMAAISLCWDVLFSPFEGHQRVTDMAELAMVLVITAGAVRAKGKDRPQTNSHLTKAPQSA